MSLERGKQYYVVQLENSPRWEQPRLPQGCLGEFQAQMLKSLWFPSLHHLLLFPYEMEQGTI